jgi:hypothetical protein
MQQPLPDGWGSDPSPDRQGGVADPEVLDQILQSNEQFIRAASQDTYWKLYFLLTGGAK